MKLLLADDHAVFRDSLRALLERGGHQIVAEAGNGREAVRLARERGPELAILDVAMPLLSGIEAARQIQRQAPGVVTVLLTMFDDSEHVLGALRAGVRGYVLKTQAAAELEAALQEVARGALYLSPGISSTVVNAWMNRTMGPADPLSDRERQVLRLIADGKSTRQIAELLSISAKTAESHRSRLMAKLDLHNVAGLVRYAIRKGMLRP